MAARRRPPFGIFVGVRSLRRGAWLECERSPRCVYARRRIRCEAFAPYAVVRGWSVNGLRGMCMRVVALRC